MKNEISIEDQIGLLLGNRPARFPFEKNIALSVFCTWLHHPDDQHVLQHAQTVAAANIFVRSKDKRRKEIPIISKETLASALAVSPIAGDFLTWFEDLYAELDALTDVVSFFMHCPPDQKTSLNRAYDFIEKNGFVDLSVSREERHQLRKYQRGTTALKVLWRDRAHTSPWLWAAQILPEILELAPDADETFQMTKDLLRNNSRLRQYFSVSKWCQERLRDRLDPNVRLRIPFIQFPASLTAVQLDIETFDQQQLKLLTDYRVKPPRKRNGPNDPH